MKHQFRLIRRGKRGNAFYCVDVVTRKRTSLKTVDEEAANQIIRAKNEAERQPLINRQIAKAYLAGTDSRISKRTWKDAIGAITATKHGTNKKRWERAAKDKAFRLILDLVIVETQGEVLLQVLRYGTVSTNVFLRRIHNFCVDMNWLPWPLIPKRQWPAVRFNS